jgi:RNA polymerase primary sigma factor
MIARAPEADRCLTPRDAPHRSRPGRRKGGDTVSTVKRMGNTAVRGLPKDITSCYLDEIGQLPRLSPEAELNLARRLNRLRRRQGRSLFASPYVVERSLSDLQQVERDGLLLSQIFEIPAIRGWVSRFRHRLPGIIQKLSRLCRRNQRDFRIVTSRSRAKATRARARRRMLRRAQVASRFLADFPWRWSHLDQLLQGYGRQVSRLRELRAQIDGLSDDDCESTRKRAQQRYRAQLMRTQEGPRATQRRLAELRRVDAQREDVRWRLVESNLRLVVAIAKGYQRRGLNLLDLVQDGNAGILRAADKFDPGRGVKFGAYAGWWIRSSIRRGFPEQVASVRIPEKGLMALWKLRKSSSGLWHLHGRPPRPVELAAAAGVGVEETQRLLDLDAPRLALDAPFGDGRSSLRDQFQDQSTELPGEMVDRRLLTCRLNRLLATLTPKEREVIELRFGLGDGCRRTLAEVGRMFNVSGEWVRRLEASALDKLRQDKCRGQLAGFLDG